MAPIVITSCFILFLVIFAVVIWCSDRTGDDQSINTNKVECLRLQFKADSEDEFQWSRVFEIDEDQPPPYEFPPAYKNIYINAHDRCISMIP